MGIFIFFNIQENGILQYFEHFKQQQGKKIKEVYLPSPLNERPMGDALVTVGKKTNDY